MVNLPGTLTAGTTDLRKGHVLGEEVWYICIKVSWNAACFFSGVKDGLAP